MSLSPNPSSLPFLLNENLISIQYQKLLKYGSAKQLKDCLLKLLNEINNLKKENSELKIRNAANSYAEVQLLNAENKIKQLQEENINSLEKQYKEQKKLEKQIEDIKLEKENEQIKNRNNMEIFNQRIEIMNHIDLENRINKEEIQSLKEKNEKLKLENENMLRNLEVLNQIKYSKLKKRMIENLKETQKNVTKLNVEYMDINSKLLVLQNNELILKIEYQSDKIEELEKNNKILKDKIFSLENELNIHKNVELKLANKLRKHSQSQNFSIEYDKNKNNSINTLKKNKEKSQLNSKLISFLSPNKSYSIYNESNSFFFSGQEKKINNLEKIIEEKKIENEKLKNQLSKVCYKVLCYENKYSGLFNFFEDCLNRFFNDIEIQQNQNFYIHIEDIKKCDFNIFSNQEKYSLLVLIMKYLLPIVNLNFNSSCNIGEGVFKTNLNVISNRFNQTQNFLNDTYLRKAFVGKSNRLKSDLHIKGLNTYYLNSIPIMKNETEKEKKKILSEPKMSIINQ